MTVKEKQEELVQNLKKWQKVENGSILASAQIIGETENPLIRLVMEIIQRDSQMHYRVQQMIINSLTTEAVSIGTDDLVNIWDSIEHHIKVEQETIDLAKASLETLKGTKSPFQSYLLSYLMADEEKHEKLLGDLQLIKKNMYPDSA